MSYSFLSNITSLSEGVEFILGKYPYYDRDTLVDKYSDMPYSFQMIVESMKGILGISTISKIVLFDALIGNSDRHHSNWGITETKAFLSYWAEFERDNSHYKTDEFRQKMSKLTSGTNNGMYGKKHTEESKQKMSINSKGKTAGNKNGMYGKSGNNALNGKRIEMYDKNWNFIQTFNAKTAVLQFLGMKGHTQLDKAIKNQTLNAKTPEYQQYMNFVQFQLIHNVL